MLVRQLGKALQVLSCRPQESPDARQDTCSKNACRLGAEAFETGLVQKKIHEADFDGKNKHSMLTAQMWG